MIYIMFLFFFYATFILSILSPTLSLFPSLPLFNLFLQCKSTIFSLNHKEKIHFSSYLTPFRRFLLIIRKFYSASASKFSGLRICNSKALVTRRTALTFCFPRPSGNNFCTSSACLFSKLFTPKGIPLNPVICSLV